VDTGLIERVIAAVMVHSAVVPVMPLVETPKEIVWETVETAAGAAFRQGFVKRHLRRANVGAAQTPQAFEFRGILAAHEKAAERELREGIKYTDDAEVWGEFCGPVAVVAGSPANRKITFPEDLPARGD
jgi:2-C-methyl-D-erythritol 4-phosphate cytidylyltransferase